MDPLTAAGCAATCRPFDNGWSASVRYKAQSNDHLDQAQRVHGMIPYCI